MTSSRHTKAQLLRHLKQIGVEEGDILFVRAEIGKIGRVVGGGDTILEALLESVGETGTILTLGFTDITPRWKLDNSEVFTEKTKSNTGALAKLFMRNISCKRSHHPVNSFLAIGQKANELLEGHTADSLSYAPMNKLRENNARMLVVGCVENSPGFTTVHSVQENLGLTKKSWFSGVAGALYIKNGQTCKYIKKDFGGCSAGFSKFYSKYLQKEVLSVGYIGNAYSLQIPMKKAYEIEYSCILENNKFFLCDDLTCFSCRVSWKNNFSGIPFFFFGKFLQLLRPGK